MSIEIRDEWKAAPDPTGSHTTVGQLLERIAKLHQRMKDKGYPCPEILTTKAASNPVVLPPLAHVAKTPIILSAAGQTVGAYDLAKVGTWLTTNAVTLPLNVTKIGTLSATDQLPIQLESGFVPSSKIANAPSAPDVYFTSIDGQNAKLVDSKDQIVVRFKQDTADILDPERISAAIRSLSTAKLQSKLIIMLLPQNKPQQKNYLDRLRLSSVRIVSLVRQFAKGGIPYDQIVITAGDQQTPISIPTLQDDEILVKMVGGAPSAFEGLSVDALKPTYATVAAKKNLELYEAMTRNVRQ